MKTLEEKIEHAKTCPNWNIAEKVCECEEKI